MAMRTYTSAEIAIPHADLLALQAAGDLTLGIGHATVEAIARTPDLQPRIITFKPASPVRNRLAVAVFALSVCLAIVDQWWHIVFGLIFMLLLGRNHKKLNIEKVLAAAEIDAAFYERHRELGNWRYRIDEDKAAPFVR
jgi:hypothetical protein